MVKSFVGFLVLVAVIALGMTLGYGPRKKAKTVLHLAPNLAELYATAAEEFDSRFAGQTVEFAGLVKNRSEETPSSGKRYLVLWGFQKSNNTEETVIHCEYIPEFASVPATGRVKLRGKLLSHAEGGKSVTVVDCQLLSVRKPFSDKLNDSGED